MTTTEQNAAKAEEKLPSQGNMREFVRLPAGGPPEGSSLAAERRARHLYPLAVRIFSVRQQS